MMEDRLQEEINKLPVIQKAHIWEPRMEEVAEISFNAGRKEERERIVGYIKENCLQTEGNQGYLILDRDIKEWEL